MRKLLTAAGLLALSLFWACHLGPEDSEDHFDLIGDSTWTECDVVQVVLLDSKGKAVDTLFNGALTDVSQLKNLSAAGYDGTSATLHISGTKDGGVCFDEKRSFEGDGQSLKIDTVKSLTAEPQSVQVQPDSLSIALDAAAFPVEASILPAFADQSVIWKLSADGVVSLINPSGGTANQVKIKPEKVGATTITVRSGKDPSKTAVLKITVTAPLGIKVNLGKDNLVLYLGGPGETLTASVEPSTVDQKISWSSMNAKVATVDSAGNVKPTGEGETYVIAKSISTEASGSALVTVKRDAPVAHHRLQDRGPRQLTDHLFAAVHPGLRRHHHVQMGSGRGRRVGRFLLGPWHRRGGRPAAAIGFISQGRHLQRQIHGARQRRQ